MDLNESTRLLRRSVGPDVVPQTRPASGGRASYAADAGYSQAARLQSLFGHRRAR
jgi:hypothetical protein